MTYRLNAGLRVAAVAAILGLGVTGQALGKTYYVEKWGTSNPNCSKSEPCIGIGDALAAATSKNDK